MKRPHLTILFIILILCNSCATKALWKATDPDSYIKIKHTDITEEKLKANGIKYYKDDSGKYYYVSKGSFDKLKDYTFRTIGTPVTIVVDATSILVVGLGVFIVSDFINTHTVNPKADPHGPPQKKHKLF